MTQDNNEPKEERKLEPYHYEAMIRAEVEKRLAAEKQAGVISQPINPPAYYESPPPHLAPQQPATGFPSPYQQSGQYPMQQTGQYYPGQVQPQQYQSGPIPYPQQYPQPYQQPQPYYQQPPAAPVINVVVNTNNVNQNVNQNYNARRYAYVRTHSSIGFANIVYFLLIGWCLGLTWAIVAVFATILNSDLGNIMMRQAFFLAFLV